MNSVASLNPAGGTLVYNPRTTAIPAVTIPAENGEPAMVIGGGAGPLNDPTAMMYVRATDLEPVSVSGACLDNTGFLRPDFYTMTGCAVRLRPGLKPEPLVLRAPAGSCVIATLYNRIPVQVPDLPTFATLQGIVKRDRAGVNGSTTFNNNLIRPSAHVGLHAQLVAFDVTKDDGVNVGQNFVQTAGPVNPGDTVAAKDVYKWYLGDIGVKTVAGGLFQLVATPVEFGGSSLIPADKIKQGQKSLMGGMVVMPAGSTVLQEDSGDNVPGSGHAAATVRKADATIVRDFLVVMAKDLNHRYSDGTPVEHMNGEGQGLPEDAQENSGMALNYGIEPLWFRFAIPPNAPFGQVFDNATGRPAGYGAIPNAHQAFSNVLPVDPNVPGSPAVGDPATPVLVASAGQEVRMHLVLPHSTSRGSTFALHGHVWQRDPYICPGEAQDGLAGTVQPSDRRRSCGRRRQLGGGVQGPRRQPHRDQPGRAGEPDALRELRHLPSLRGREGRPLGRLPVPRRGLLRKRQRALGDPPGGGRRCAATGDGGDLDGQPGGDHDDGEQRDLHGLPRRRNRSVRVRVPGQRGRRSVRGDAAVRVGQPVDMEHDRGLRLGDFQVRAFVRTVGNPGFDALATIPYTLTAAPVTVSLSANPADNTARGNNVTFTAVAGGGAGGAFEYEFRLQFNIVRPYSQDNTWVWDNTALYSAGVYQVQVLVREVGTITPSGSTVIPYTLTGRRRRG